jgi:hypothetical protein
MPDERLAVGTAFFYDWIDRNGPGPNIEPRPLSVDAVETTAIRVEVAGWPGKRAGFRRSHAGHTGIGCRSAEGNKPVCSRVIITAK